MSQTQLSSKKPGNQETVVFQSILSKDIATISFISNNAC